MKKYLILILTLLAFLALEAQIVDNKFNMYAGYSYGNFLAPEAIDEDGFISPSIYGNFEQLQGAFVKGLSKSQKFNNLSWGFSYSYRFATDWYSDNYEDYLDADITMHTFKVLSRVHTRYREKGIWNRIQVYFEGAAGIGFSQLALEYPIFNIQEDTTNIDAPMTENKIFLGLSWETGIDVYLPKNLGVFVACSGEIYWISSKFYNDNHFSPMMIRAGLIYRLSKNKRFSY